MSWYHKGTKVLVPDFNFGRNVDQDNWDSWFPNAPKRPNESEEEYQKRLSIAAEKEG